MNFEYCFLCVTNDRDTLQANSQFVDFLFTDKVISSQNILDAIFDYKARQDMQSTPERPSQSRNQAEEHRKKPFMINSKSTAKDLVNLSEFVEPRQEAPGMYGSANPWATRMHSKEHRLSTFVRWPKEHVVSAESLAEFGW